MGNVGEHLARRFDAGDVGRIVQGREIGELAEGGERRVVDDDRLGEPVAPVHHTVAHRRDVREAGDRPDLGVQEGFHDQLDGVPVVGAVLLLLDLLSALLRIVVDERPADGHPLDDTGGEHVLLLPAIQLVLQGRAAAVQREDVHSRLLVMVNIRKNAAALPASGARIRGLPRRSFRTRS